MAVKYLDETGLAYFWGKLKSYFQPAMSVTTTTNTLYLRDGSATATSKATGQIVTRTYGRVHDVYIWFDLSNVTISTIGIITGTTGLPDYAKFPAVLNITGSKYAVVALQNSSAGIYLRGDINGSMNNPTFTTDSAGALRSRFVWVE